MERLDIETDLFNSNHTRNSHNTPCDQYNCGGFALNTFHWLTPYLRIEDLDYDENDWTEEKREQYIYNLALNNLDTFEIAEKIVECDVDFLLNKYSFLRKVSVSELNNTNRFIAYRVGVDENLETDFHFKVSINGFWFEKNGKQDIHLCDLITDANWEYPDFEDIYTTSIIYFQDMRF